MDLLRTIQWDDGTRNVMAFSSGGGIKRDAEGEEKGGGERREGK